MDMGDHYLRCLCYSILGFPVCFFPLQPLCLTNRCSEHSKAVTVRESAPPASSHRWPCFVRLFLTLTTIDPPMKYICVYIPGALAFLWGYLEAASRSKELGGAALMISAAIVVGSCIIGSQNGPENRYYRPCCVSIAGKQYSKTQRNLFHSLNHALSAPDRVRVS